MSNEDKLKEAKEQLSKTFEELPTGVKIVAGSAAAGATIGSVVPVIGTVIGGVIGTAVGSFFALKNKD